MRKLFCRPFVVTAADPIGLQLYWTSSSDTDYSYWTQDTSPILFDDVHDHGGNLIFVDGHGEFRKYADLRSKDFGLAPDESWSPGVDNHIYTRAD